MSPQSHLLQRCYPARGHQESSLLSPVLGHDILSRCIFSTFTPRLPMDEIYLLTLCAFRYVNQNTQNKLFCQNSNSRIRYPLDYKVKLGDYPLLHIPPVAPPRNLLTLGREFESRCRQTNSNKWRTINSLVHKIRLHGRRGKGTAESFSREKLREAPQKEGEKSCETFLLCDLGWYVHKPDVQNKWDDNTHTHTHTHSGDVIY